MSKLAPETSPSPKSIQQVSKRHPKDIQKASKFFQLMVSKSKGHNAKDCKEPCTLTELPDWNKIINLARWRVAQRTGYIYIYIHIVYMFYVCTIYIYIYMYMGRMGSIWCNWPGQNRVNVMLGSGSELVADSFVCCFASNRDSFKGWSPKHQIDPIGPNTRTSKRMLWVCQWGCCDAKPLKVSSLGTTFMECVEIVCGQGLTSLNWRKLRF